ncbi:MAG: hypothetical protein LBE36_12240 [Flavobacteriaceae bacterium]|jgi:hypothetical protein|nr:hypothetical protein [Flavobacteriaceae bacterium]
MKIIILPEVIDYFEDLMEILYQKEYFGFQESASEYVIELIETIKTNLHRLPHKFAPTHFDRYEKNMKYAVFKRNRNTSWYVFFTSYKVEHEIVYLIRHVENNHTAAKYF